MDFNLSLKLYTSQQVRSGEIKAAQIAGVSMYDLMQKAGIAVYKCFRQHYSDAQRVLVVCGKGNNGGDGYVFASLAKQAGLQVRVFHLGEINQLDGDAKIAYEEWCSIGGHIEHWDDWHVALLDAEVIIDAMLGTGLRGPLNHGYQLRITQINQINCPVISVDIPSGLNADTGAVHGVAIQAKHTVTFVAVKQGLCTGQARSYIGKLHFAGLGTSAEFRSIEDESALGIDHQIIPRLIPDRQKTAHKGHHGKALCVGGNRGMAGAIRLCALGAVRSGVGLAAAITHPESLLSLQMGIPEVMSTAISLKELGDIENVLAEKTAWASVLIIGPGLGNDEWAHQIYQYLAQQDLPKVVDADGLNILAQVSRKNNSALVYDKQRIITPHSGEAARLLGVSVDVIENDRFSAIKQLHEKYGGAVVLKGAGTLIYDGVRMYACLAGNSGMATGGMGDVLTGVIGAFVAKGLPLATAARLGVVVHSHAADLDAAQSGEYGLLASDVVNMLRLALNP